jgi:hypothetical protein
MRDGRKEVKTEIKKAQKWIYQGNRWSLERYFPPQLRYKMWDDLGKANTQKASKGGSRPSSISPIGIACLGYLRDTFWVWLLLQIMEAGDGK